MKQLILATNKFQKNDLDIRYASIDKRTSVYVKNSSYLRLEDDVAIILGFEPRTTINNSLLMSPYLSLTTLTTGKVSSLYVYTDIIHSQYVSVVGQNGNSVTIMFDRPQYLQRVQTDIGHHRHR